jgi:hypothetical protein
MPPPLLLEGETAVVCKMFKGTGAVPTEVVQFFLTVLYSKKYSRVCVYKRRHVCQTVSQGGRRRLVDESFVALLPISIPISSVGLS